MIGQRISHYQILSAFVIPWGGDVPTGFGSSGHP
jgi:hypothetical protein